MKKMADNKNRGGGVRTAEELDEFISSKITTEEDLEKNVESFAEAVQSACRRSFQNTYTRKKVSNKKTFPWWTDNLTLM
jgi:hypothetical protein